jgi:PhnB protein
MEIQAITPKLAVRDATAAHDYYRRALGAEVVECYAHHGLVVFSKLAVGGVVFEVKDSDQGVDPPPPVDGKGGVLISVTVDDPDTLGSRMVEAGGTVVFPVADQPYGARGGRILDPFGHQWLLQTPAWLSPTEIQAAIDAMRV